MDPRHGCKLSSWPWVRNTAAPPAHSTLFHWLYDFSSEPGGPQPLAVKLRHLLLQCDVRQKLVNQAATGLLYVLFFLYVLFCVSLTQLESSEEGAQLRKRLLEIQL